MRDFLSELRESDISVRVVDGELSIKYPKGKSISPTVLNEIRAKKSELLAYLTALDKSQYNDIPVALQQESYPLSSSQRRLWILSQLQEVSQAYHIGGAYTFKGELNVPLLEKALLLLIERHEVLRTVFRTNNREEINQFILAPEQLAFTLRHDDLRKEALVQEKVRTIIQEDNNTSFDLAAGPLLRARIMQTANREYVFSYVMHHIITDAWSMEVLIKELLLLYNACNEGRESPLPPLRLQYKDYACWQQQQLTGDALKQHKGYWLNHLQGELPLLELPGSKVRPAIKTYNGAKLSTQIDAAIVSQLKALNRSHDITLFMSLLAVVNTLLHYYSGQEDIVIGTPIAGRDHADLENQLGFYLNTLALRTQFKGSNSFSELLTLTKKTLLGAYEHQVYPFDELVENLPLKRDISRNALFDVMVVLFNEEVSGKQASQYRLGELAIQPFATGDDNTSRFDLTFTFAESAGGLQAFIEYNTDLYSEELITGLLSHLKQLLYAVTAFPSVPLNELDWMSGEERELILSEFNDTAIAFEEAVTITTLFEQQAAQAPASIALEVEAAAFTYRQLNEQANQLAAWLRHQHAIQAGDVVGIKLERTEWLIITLLGVLKSGAAYMPIDPAYPEERVHYLQTDSHCKLTIDETTLATFRAISDHYKTDNLAPLHQPNDLAYVIYTSGSTGKPKGVMIEHRSVTTFMNWCQLEYGALDFEVIFGVTSVCFDLSVFEIFFALTSGKKLRLLRTPFDIPRYLQQEKVLLNTVPSMVKVLLDEGTDLSAVKILNLGGEATPVAYTKRLYASGFDFEVINVYGPTEATVYASACRINEDRPLSIGRPIDNYELYVVNERHRLCPVGIPGEICIGGKGLARGYWNRQELTDAVFVANPFRKGERMYKTGDIGRWLPDGTIECYGRRDHQLKIKGYRIEPGEIEQLMLAHPDINAAVVLGRANKEGEKELVAYTVSEKKLAVQDILSWLKRDLPDYMIPTRYVQLATMPLTANGKIDKLALPDPDGIEIATGTEHIGARNELEAQLVAVWQQILGKAAIGVKDNFFVAGGDSIKSIQVVARLKQRGYSITIRDIMLYPVLEDLALRVKPVVHQADQSLVQGRVPLSPVQQYFFKRYPVNNHYYNQSLLLRANGNLVETALQQSLHKLILHHDALRMVYRSTPSGWIQENQGAHDAPYFEVIAVDNAAELLRESIRIKASMNLLEGPLFKAVLIRGLEHDQLLLVAHHLVIDGISWRILLEDLEHVYSEYMAGKEPSLPLKTDSFKYWQEQQMVFADSAALQKEVSWWKEVDGVAPDRLPLDHTTGTNLFKDIAGEAVLLNEQLTADLIHKCYKAYSTDINDILLTGLSLALQEVFGMQQALIKLEGHGREPFGSDADVNRTVGWFTTMYPIVLNVQYPNDPIRQLIAVKEYVHRIPNKGIGYGILEHFTGMPFLNKPAITFNYLGAFGRQGGNDNGSSLFEFSTYSTGADIAGDMERDALLDVTGVMTDGKLSLAIAYSNKQFNPETIQRMAAAYQRHLEFLIQQLAAHETNELTPVDCTYKALSVEQLQALNADHNLEDIYPLSPLQEGLYYHWLVSKESFFYFDQVHYRLKGKLDIAVIEKSYSLLVDRYAVLRTSFLPEQFSDRILQVVKKKVSSEFIYREFDNCSATELEHYKREDIRRGFDLYNGSQMRLSVLALGNDVYEFIWSHHHILMDGWCTGILITDFFQIYNALVQGKEAVLSKVDQYATYIDWLERIDQPTSLNYWRNYLSGYNTVASVPKKEIREQRSYERAERTFAISEEVTRSIKSICAQSGITESTFIQTIWGILLCRYNNTNDVVFGIVVSGRPGEIPGIERMVGLFINSIPLRIQVQPGTTAAELLKEVQLASVETAPHHYTQLADIHAETELGQHVFDHLVQFQNFPVQQMVEQSVQNNGSSQSLAIESASFFAENDFDFTVIVSPGNKLEISLMYNGALYEDIRIQRIEDHITAIIKQIVADPTIVVDDIVCVSAAEREELLTTFNATQWAYPREATITALFEEQVKQTPEGRALVAGKKAYTYQTLNEQSNQLAHYLRKNHTIQPNEVVAIKLEPRDQMIIAMLAVLKAGGAYLPIDPEYPDNRIRHMVTDSQCKLLLDEEEWANFNTQRSLYSKGNPAPVNTSDDLAYIIYTSGSTGKPKGTMVQHRSLVNVSCWQKQALSLTTDDRATLYLGVAFDAAVIEFFPAIIAGACLYAVPKEIRMDARLLAKYFEDNAITIGALPAQMAEQFMEEENQSLRYLISGGDKLTLCPGNNYAVVNQYGPTENTVVTACFIIEKGQSYKRPPIGKPIHNVKAYILDKQKRLVPVGVAGELFVGGDNLSRGYINNPALTAEKFITNPFGAGEKIYSTGDLCRWLPDGNMEFVGRRDEQVKIRGFRIELGEIENALLASEDITSVVVMARTDTAGEKILVAYLVGRESLNVSDLREFLKASLPAYMLPAHYVQLDALPLNANGKVDKNALPDPNGLNDARGTTYVAPRTVTERKLVEIWEDVLGRKGIGVTHDFFESGGHSLRATRLSSQIHKKLNAEIPLANIFAHPVLEDQALLIENINKSTYSSIEQVPEQNDGYEVSPSQRRLWMLAQFDKNNIAYNIPGCYEFTGPLHKEALEAAFTTLIGRHEILRTIFKENAQGEVRQYVLPANESHFAITWHNAGDDAVQDLLQQEVNAPFDLAAGPLMRVKLIQTADRVHVFSYVMHHIISDGWSMQIMIKEIMALYNGYAAGKPIVLPPLRIQYKDFAAWQLQQLQGDKLQVQKQYWQNQLAGDIPVLEFPTDHTRPPVKTFRGGTIQRTFNKEIGGGLRRMSQLQNGTLFMGLLATVNTLLYKYTGQEDLIIGTPVAGRTHADLEDQIGFYINTLAVRTKFNAAENFLTLLGNIRQVTLGAFEHQVYPFDDLVDMLALKRDISRTPLFDVFMVLQNTALAQVADNTITDDNKVLSINKYDFNDGISRFDLTFNFAEAGEDLVLNLEYNTDLFNSQSMIRLIDHLELLLQKILTSPQTPLYEIELLSDEEKNWLVNEVNARKGVYPTDQTVAELFEAQVERTPDHVAVCYNNTTLTYAELNVQANRLAAYLISNYQIAPDDLVAIQLQRSEWLIITLLAVLKAGGAYVPVDPAYPQERIQYMLRDSQCKVVIDDSELAKFNKDALTYTSNNPARTANAGNLAYVIYTSGSTGQPKGVMVEHKGLINTIAAQIDIFNITAADRGLQFASFSFDAFAWESFMMLLAGGSLTIVNDELRRNPAGLISFIIDRSINIISLLPVYLRQLDLSRLTHLKVLVSGGEAAQYDLFETLSDKAVAYNVYGPTEASICGTIYNLGTGAVSSTQNIPIGTAISNARIYVLDEHGRLCPINVPGEICIAGPGVARGYINQPVLTEEKFVADPFVPGERVYKTGDIGRWLADGNLEFIQRKDEQVKVRGYRIELGEIETALRKHAHIGQAAVVTRNAAQQEKELVAYIVSDSSVTTTELRNWLATLLPAHMMPAHFIRLAQLPMTANGKLDKKALPDVATAGSSVDPLYEAPANEIEEKLLAIWQQLLNRKDIGVTDNFFEAGGNSIKIIQLSKQISQQLHTEVSVGVLFQYASIRSLVEYLKQGTGSEEESIGQEELMDALDKFNFDDNE